MHTHMCFQVAFGGERAAADSTFERPLAGVSSQVSLFAEEKDLFYNLRQTGIILLLKFIFGG